MATIRERKPGVWEVRVFTGRDAQGRPRQSSRTVRGSKRALLPTLARPHFDVLLPDLDDETLDRLELGFDNAIPNPAREGQA